MTSLVGTAPQAGVGRRLNGELSSRKRLGATLLGVGLLVGLWVILASRQPELIFPSPIETWHGFTGLVRDGSLHRELARTLGRAAVAIGFAFVIGAGWGVATGVSQWAAAVSQPALSTLMAVPPVVVVALALVWFGPGGAVARLVVVFVALPLIVVAVQEAVRNIDQDLLEMASTFRLSRWSVLRHIIVPATTSPVLAAASVTIGQALRVVVMAELLSSADGIGAEVARSRANLETADLFAWAITLIAVVIVIETVLLKPFIQHVLRWRTPATSQLQHQHSL